jgi:23S rRNA (guanosine2251-2'-O)-methyltransferase
METLEGRHAVLAALRARVRRIEVILLKVGIHAEAVSEIISLAETMGIPLRRVGREELDAITHGRTHGGVVAVAGPKPRTTPEQLCALLDSMDRPPLLLLIEGVDDARNLGFTLRTALSLGADAVLIKKHLWDLDPIEIARPSSGAYELMPLVQVSDMSPVAQLRKRGLQLIGCIAGVRRTARQTDLTGGTILAIGGEKRGLSGAIRDFCDQLITIPTVPGSTSLPLSHAAAIMLYEARMQRLNTAGTSEPPGP